MFTDHGHGRFRTQFLSGNRTRHDDSDSRSGPGSVNIEHAQNTGPPYNEEAIQQAVDPPDTEAYQTDTTPDGAKLKDPKSFTQNLFDTFALRMLEWLPLRRPVDTPSAQSTVPRKHSYKPSSPNDISPEPFNLRNEKRSSRREDNGPTDGPKPSQRTLSTSTISSQPPTAVEVKIPGQPIKRLSLTDLDIRRQASRHGNERLRLSEPRGSRKLSSSQAHLESSNYRLPSPPPLKHRPQKHRHVNTDLSLPQDSGRTPSHRCSWEGPQSPIGKHAEDVRSRRISDGRHTQPVNKSEENKDSCEDESIIQSLDHLSGEIVTVLDSMMFATDKDRKLWEEEIQAQGDRGLQESWAWTHASEKQKSVANFVSQSVFYVLSSPERILRSFSLPADVCAVDKVHHLLDTTQLEESFPLLYSMSPHQNILHSLWMGLEKLLTPPKDLSTSSRHLRRMSNGSIPRPRPQWDDQKPSEHIGDSEAAYVATVSLYALASFVPRLSRQSWCAIRKIRGAGVVLPAAELQEHVGSTIQMMIEVTDRFEHDLALRLASRLARVVSARLAFNEILKIKSAGHRRSEKCRKRNAVDMIIQCFQKSSSFSKTHVLHEPFTLPADLPPTVPSIVVEWMRTILLNEWNGVPEVLRSSAAGGALLLLSHMYHSRSAIGLEAEDFQIPLFSERLDPIEVPVEWLSKPPNNRVLHFLSYPFLFRPSSLVSYFRAMNYSVMSKSFDTSLTAFRHITQTAYSNPFLSDDSGLLDRLETEITPYLALDVRRDNVLTDAFNQLWRRERRELFRPLKVKLGTDEGEEGLDHGGVQQEFFRVAMNEAMNPDFGMFTTDERNDMAWFQPGSMEPLYKFEMLGLLMSLAVYNGLTLPISFPTAFYMKLLDIEVKTTDHIRNGWTDLAKGFDELLSWKDGDVGDIFMRTYEFSFRAFGAVINVNMDSVGRDDPWPAPENNFIWRRNRNSPLEQVLSGSNIGDHFGSLVTVHVGDEDANDRHHGCGHSPGHSHGPVFGILKSPGALYPQVPTQPPVSNPRTQEAPLVTNANRKKFVKDYIFWLTDKSVRPQYEALARGFYTCLDRKALSIFTPEALRAVVEGIRHIDPVELQRYATYEGGFAPDSPAVIDFWSVLRSYPQEKLRALLEFVTASGRVPVNGLASITFVVQRNGEGDEVSGFPFFFLFLLVFFNSYEIGMN